MTQSLHDQLRVIATNMLADDGVCLTELMQAASLPLDGRERAVRHAQGWVESIRRDHRPSVSVTDLLSRFGLTSHEGLSLMCLAEALLRIPDRATADALIRDKLSDTHWLAALGKDAPLSLNAAGWALSITGKIIDLQAPEIKNAGDALGTLVSRLGQPAIREAIKAAMKWLADQFVTGETITDALRRSHDDRAAGVRFSFDMLGEGARAAADAGRYLADYSAAIDAIGQDQQRNNFKNPSGISVKLSALHPRYEIAHRQRVMDELLPRIQGLCLLAAQYNIPLTIDAEESERLQLSLELAEALLRDPQLGEWHGLGFAVQAYQKRAPHVIDFLVHHARANRRRIHIRLVKGAYWDSEIKKAQEKGFSDFPVFTRKESTDVSYQACARRMLVASEWIDPVFGTHNAMTVAHITELAGGVGKIEFQRLHGMGEELHGLMRREGYRCCVYAPVGDHDVLLGYLVRRILENGANSSFVHRLLDPTVSVGDLLADPVHAVRTMSDVRHPHVVMPDRIFMPQRTNSVGVNLSDPFVTDPLLKAIDDIAVKDYPTESPVYVEQAFSVADQQFLRWRHVAVDERAQILERLAAHMERHASKLYALLIKEAGKTVPDAVGEVREAVDFCRYYAAEARVACPPMLLPSVTGERNELRLVGRGTFLCISPWNFPLAIFLGQVVAALVMGNCVIAKPAPQTPRIALLVASWLEECGLPEGVLQIVTGGSDVGAVLVGHRSVAGVAFTGSTTTAWAINRALAAKNAPIIPLIAETGGQNAMIVDSSALPEQVVDDVINSAFRSAGQRCSALRVLYLPHDTADKILAMLTGALQELKVGDPALLATDIGPVIDEAAAGRLQAHLDVLAADSTCRFVAKYTGRIDGIGNWRFVVPHIWEIPQIAWLRGEVFGPILHVVRYAPRDLPQVIQDINATGFGLTGGLHSRIDSSMQMVQRELRVGNLYVNRSMIGAVVGSQPFGGMGLSGTGPKAGGAHYLSRFATEQVISTNTTAAGGNASLLAVVGRD